MRDDCVDIRSMGVGINSHSSFHRASQPSKRDAMGQCFSAPDDVVTSAHRGMRLASRVAVLGVEVTGVAARRAARKATLTKYALVKCEFDAECERKAKRLEVIRELVREQRAIWRAWTNASKAMEPSVLMHWGKHCEGSRECATRLNALARRVLNARDAHKEYVAHISSAFLEKLQEGITTIDDAWGIYESYEHAEYKLKYATRDKKLPEEEKAKLTSEMENAKRLAMEAMTKAVENVEKKSLVPAYEAASRELDKFVKRCSQSKEEGVVDIEQVTLTASATMQRANSIAYSKAKKRTYTSIDAIRIAKHKYDRLKMMYARTDLSQQYLTNCEKLSAMKRHALAMKLVFDDFEPYIRILFGPDEMREFVDDLCNKLDGYKTFKAAAAALNDRVRSLNEAIDIEAYRTKAAEMEKHVIDETEKVFERGKSYEEELAEFPKLEKPIFEAQNEINQHVNIMPPVEPGRLVEYTLKHEKRARKLQDAQNAQVIAKERIEAELDSHTSALNRLMMNTDCIFYETIIAEIEQCCKAITDAETVAKSVAIRVIKDEAVSPEAEVALVVQESLVEAVATAAEAAAAQAAAVEADAKRDEEAKAAKAKTAAEAAEASAAQAAVEEDEKKKEELSAKAQAERTEAEKLRVEAKQAEKTVAIAAKEKLKTEERARKAWRKAQKELERKIAEANEKATTEAAAAQTDAFKEKKRAEAGFDATVSFAKKNDAEVARQISSSREEEERAMKKMLSIKSAAEDKQQAHQKAVAAMMVAAEEKERAFYAKHPLDD